MDNGIEIEPATQADTDIMEALARLLPQLAPTVAVPSVEQVRQIIASPCTTILLARDRAQGGRIVGILTLAVFRIPTGLRAWIEDVVVDTTARGKGVGAALSREALRVAHSNGARTVELTSRPTREAANQLYRRIGFRSRETNVYRYSFEE